jgi:hypothetical protein
LAIEEMLQGRRMVGLSGVGGYVGGGGSYSGAYDEPEGVATEASPEGASFGGGDGGVAFAGEGVELGEVIGVVLLGGG